jgi:hypothetical protein
MSALFTTVHIYPEIAVGSIYLGANYGNLQYIPFAPRSSRFSGDIHKEVATIMSEVADHQKRDS